MTKQPGVVGDGGRRCGACDAPLTYAGTGRPPRYCSPACRTRAWAVRRYGGGSADGGNGHQAATEDTATAEPAAPAVGAPQTAREWAATLDGLAVAIATGPLGKRHYDHRHLVGPLQRVWAALDATHPGGLDALQRQHHGRR